MGWSQLETNPVWSQIETKYFGLQQRRILETKWAGKDQSRVAMVSKFGFCWRPNTEILVSIQYLRPRILRIRSQMIIRDRKLKDGNRNFRSQNRRYLVVSQCLLTVTNTIYLHKICFLSDTFGSIWQQHALEYSSQLSTYFQPTETINGNQ